MNTTGPEKLLPDQAAPVVVVTGASSGIGKAVALLFARRGARLALAARSADPLDQVADECRRAGAADVVAKPTDIAEAEQVQQFFDATLARFGRVDIAAQCAALTAFGRFDELPIDSFESVVRTNLIGATNVARVALVHFGERRRGQLVLVGSLLGQVAMPYQSAYVASKFGVHGMVRALRQEYSRLPDVKIHGIYPGPVATPISDHAANYFGHAARVPPAAVGPETVARAILRATRRRSSSERHVGWFNRPMLGLYRLVPSFFDAIAAPLTRALQFGAPVAESLHGNIFPSGTARPDIGPEQPTGR